MAADGGSGAVRVSVRDHTSIVSIAVIGVIDVECCAALAEKAASDGSRAMRAAAAL